MEPENRSSFETNKGLDINATAAKKETPGVGENMEYLSCSCKQVKQEEETTAGDI